MWVASDLVAPTPLGQGGKPQGLLQGLGPPGHPGVNANLQIGRMVTFPVPVATSSVQIHLSG